MLLYFISCKGKTQVKSSYFNCDKEQNLISQKHWLETKVSEDVDVHQQTPFYITGTSSCCIKRSVGCTLTRMVFFRLRQNALGARVSQAKLYI